MVLQGRLRGRYYLLGAVYLLAIGQTLFTRGIGEPYPSLQGPMFSGHLQQGSTVYVPFYRDDPEHAHLPSHQKLLHHETLALPVQDDDDFAPSLSNNAAREFLIGHSLRTSGIHRGEINGFDHVQWSCYKYHLAWDAPPRFEGEEDLIHD